MSDELINNEVVPAKLEDGEALIPATVSAEVVEKLVEQYEEAVIAQEEKIKDEEQKLAPVENGAIGSVKTVKTSPKAKAKVDKVVAEDKVAVFSTSNVTWNGVGKVYRGINIVSAEAAEKWLERSHIRIATPEEVAKEYGL